jgi:hypothetical protein
MVRVFSLPVQRVFPHPSAQTPLGTIKNGYSDAQSPEVYSRHNTHIKTSKKPESAGEEQK